MCLPACTNLFLWILGAESYWHVIHSSIHPSIPFAHHILLLFPIPVGYLTYLIYIFLFECVMQILSYVLVFLVYINSIAFYISCH